MYNCFEIVEGFVSYGFVQPPNKSIFADLLPFVLRLVTTLTTEQVEKLQLQITRRAARVEKAIVYCFIEVLKQKRRYLISFCSTHTPCDLYKIVALFEFLTFLIDRGISFPL